VVSSSSKTDRSLFTRVQLANWQHRQPAAMHVCSVRGGCLAACDMHCIASGYGDCVCMQFSRHYASEKGAHCAHGMCSIRQR
jgi:hypothetical protein